MTEIKTYMQTRRENTLRKALKNIAFIFLGVPAFAITVFLLLNCLEEVIK